MVSELSRIWNGIFKYLVSPTLQTDEIKVAKFDVASQEQMIGVAHMYLKNLLYLFEIRRTIPILDNSGEPAGELHVEMFEFSAKFPDDFRLPILPSDFKRPDDGQADPKMLVGKKINIVIRVLKVLHNYNSYHF